MKKVLTFSIILILLALLANSCMNNTKKQSGTQQNNVKDTTKTALSPDQMVKRGDYLVTLLGCDDCHSPKEMGPQGPQVIAASRLSGYPAFRPVMKADPALTKSEWILFNPDLTMAVGPWGTSFSANLTPDQTGLGSWTLDNFKTAIREGKFMGQENGRTLLPPMPWQDLKIMTDDDLSSVFAFLKTVTAVSNIVPAAIIAQNPGNQVNPK